MSICTYHTDINTHWGAHWKHLETPPMRTTTNVLPEPNMSCIKITWITFTYDWPHRNFHPDWYNPSYMHETVQSPTRSHRLWHLRGFTQFKKTHLRGQISCKGNSYLILLNYEFKCPTISEYSNNSINSKQDQTVNLSTGWSRLYL